MADDATVILSAQDNLTAPILKAVAALQQLQAAIGEVSDAAGDIQGSAGAAESGVAAVGAASANSVIPHRAAHQALNLVSQDLAALAGASPAAEGGIRVMDSVMLQMAITGGKVSLGFIGIVAAAVGAGVAMKNIAEGAKKADEELTKMTDAAVKSVSGLDILSASQMKVAGVGAAQLQQKMIDLKTQIAALNEKIRDSAASVEATGRAYQNASNPIVTTGQSFEIINAILAKLHPTQDQAAQDSVKHAAQLSVLQNELKKTSVELDNLTIKNVRYHESAGQAATTEFLRGINAEAAALKTEADQITEVQSALGNYSATMEQVGSVAQSMGVTYVEAARVMAARTQALQSGIMGLAQTIGQALGKAIMGSKDAWKEALVAMVGQVFDMATAVVIAAGVMNKALTAAWIPGTFVGIFALVAVLQAAKYAAMAGISKAIGAAASGDSQSSAGSTESVSGSSSPSSSGAGGTAVSSAQSNVTNNIVVNLPVQALDLSSISDMQLKSLANRVGRVMAEASGQGQLSFAGA